MKLPSLTPEDYYFNENGLMVFTAKYHLKRGYCCQNGCRHCPYGFRKKEDDQKPRAPEDQEQYGS